MQTSTQIFYNRVAFLYPFINLFLKRQRRLLQKEVNAMPAGRLLEIGVGNGSHLRDYKNHHITGIDISEVMLHKAERFASSTIQLQQMDAHSLSFSSGSFDYIVLSHVLAVAESPGQVIMESYRVLKSGGQVFILNHFTPPGLAGFVDRAFQPLSSLLHFRSKFSVHDLPGLDRFKTVSERSIGLLSYYKLIILQKP